MSAGYQLLLMIAGMHVLGLVCVAVLMVLALRQPPEDDRRPSDPGSDDGWGNEPRQPRRPYDRPWGGIPLPDAEQAGVRLRDARKLGDLRPNRERRPAREPERAPVHQPG
ncbi:MAG: hypothetical protein E6G05_06460 [Actinobacteria bacterium]|nr:MAG: hypothetical protein E6G05_06460 [Actinomycetota bacterium]